MGQRLNVEILNNGERIANCYRHWSAYTSSAAAYTTEWLAAFDDCDPCWSTLYRVIVAFNVLHGGFNKGEMAAIAARNWGKDEVWLKKAIADPQFAAIDRNEGLVSITEKGMDETRNWEEGRVTIDVGKREIDFSVFFEDDEDYEDDEEEDDDDEEQKTSRSFPTILDIEPDCIPWEDFDSFAEVVSHCVSYYKTPSGTILCAIE